jgi:hypothetical protein
MLTIGSTQGQNRRALSRTLSDDSYNRLEIPKVKLPDTYNGDRTKLKQFLAQARLYIYFNNKKFPTEQHKVL